MFEKRVMCKKGTMTKSRCQESVGTGRDGKESNNGEEAKTV